MIKNLKIYLLTFAVILLYAIIFESGLIKYLALGSDYLFADFIDIPKALNCLNLNYNSYSDTFDGPSEYGCKGFSYGPIILYAFPLKKTFFYFYENFLPLILIIIFSLSVIKIINPKNKLGYVICFLSLFNPATLLMIERMNIDILFAIILIFISYNKIYFLNWILVIYSFLGKFYPFIYGLIIFIENPIRKKFHFLLIFFFIIFSSLIFIYFFWEEYIYIMDSNWAMGLHYLFSIKTVPKIINELFNIHYGLLILIFLILFIIFNLKLIKKLPNKLFDLDFTFNEKLFFLSSNTLVFCFLVFSNAYYREVFIILSIPYLISLINYKTVKIIVSLILAKFIFNFIYIIFLNFETFYYENDLRIYTSSFLLITLIKGIIDFILVGSISSIVLVKNLKLLNHCFNTNFLKF